MTHLRTLAREYLDWIALSRNPEHDADTRRYCNAQRSHAHDALIAVLGPDYEVHSLWSVIAESCFARRTWPGLDVHW